VRHFLNRNSVSALSFTAIFAVITGCESRSFESAPEEIVNNEMSLETRLKMQDETDSKLNQVEAASRKVLKVVDYIIKATGKVLGEKTYTSVDLFLDLNDSFRKKLPKKIRKGDGANVTFSTIRLPDILSLHGCRELDTRMMTLVNANSEIIQITYSMNSCADRSKYVSVANISFVDGVHFRVIGEGLKSIFGDTFEKTVGDQFSCTAKTEKSGSYKVASVQCSKISFNIGTDVQVQIKNYSYTDYGTKTVFAFAQLFQAGILKAYISVSGSSEGSLKVDIDRANAEIIEPSVEENNLVPEA